jgi:hypothetical protein
MLSCYRTEMEMGCGMDLMERKNMPKEIAAEAEAARGRSDKKLAAVPETLRLMELEMENFRLNRLVAELLLKNQELRKAD